MAKHEKMYRGSPRIEADETGKKVIKKGPTEAEKKAAETQSGTDGIQEHDSETHKLMHKHLTERMELHQKHERELVDHMHKKSSADGKTGEKEIGKIEKNKKE